MGYLEMLAAFIAICEKALLMGKTLAPNLKRLSPQEIQLLLAAEDGHFLLIDCGHMCLLHVGGRSWGDVDQPDIAAQYLDAFERLCARGLIRSISKHHFWLTGAGFRLRQRLLAEQSSSWTKRFFSRLCRWISGVR